MDFQGFEKSFKKVRIGFESRNESLKKNEKFEIATKKVLKKYF